MFKFDVTLAPVVAPALDLRVRVRVAAVVVGLEAPPQVGHVAERRPRLHEVAVVDEAVDAEAAPRER